MWGPSNGEMKHVEEEINTAIIMGTKTFLNKDVESTFSMTAGRSNKHRRDRQVENIKGC